MDRFHTITAQGVAVTLDLSAGHIRQLFVEQDGRPLTPFHTAPWINDPAVIADPTIDANLRHLSIDFFCAPFAKSDVEAAPPHGWPANSAWLLVEQSKDPDGASALYRLEKTVLGATVEKRFTIRNGHPFLYQTHVFRGGHGAVPVANHAMVALPGGGTLAFSAKDRIETPATPQESDPARGRSLLAGPAETADPTHVPLADGTFADITRYPFADRHEDFAMLVEATGSRLGWFAASRPASGDAMLSLKNPGDFPVTFLWFSNGGRFYPPWNGRHTGVLGVEEGRAYSVHGHRASIEPNPLSARGTPTALDLVPGGEVAVRNVIGAVSLPASGATVTSVEALDGGLGLIFADGERRSVPFDSRFLDA